MMSMFRISVFDVVEGEVVARSATDSLVQRTFRNAMNRAGVTVHGKSMTAEVITYVEDDSLTAEQKETLAVAMTLYQAKEDTNEYGLEWDLFHNLYLTADERAILHAGEARFDEAKLQASLSETDKFVKLVIQSIRRNDGNVKKCRDMDLIFVEPGLWTLPEYASEFGISVWEGWLA